MYVFLLGSTSLYLFFSSAPGGTSAMLTMLDGIVYNNKRHATSNIDKHKLMIVSIDQLTAYSLYRAAVLSTSGSNSSGVSG